MRALLTSLTSLTSLCLTLTLLSACQRSDSQPAEPKAQANTTTEASAPKRAEAQPKSGAPLTLSAEGQRFEPPVEPSALPEGAFYCDMGTVHYARAERGDGECPICHMSLKQKGAQQEAAHSDAPHEKTHAEGAH